VSRLTAALPSGEQIAWSYRRKGKWRVKALPVRYATGDLLFESPPEVLYDAPTREQAIESLAYQLFWYGGGAVTEEGRIVHVVTEEESHDHQ